MPLAISGTTGITLATQFDSASTFGFKNRIINGAMVIDQRNAGASVTINSAAWTYVMDRWTFYGQSADGVYTIQRSTTAPAGFTNSALITVTTADASIGSTQIYLMRQPIEGFNTADLSWGTANAQTITISFWVRSSVTGTFGGYLMNDSGDRSYPFTFTINSANTFEQKSVTVAGDTTGTWATGSGGGINLGFQIGAGSSRTGTAGAWAGAAYYGATGATNLIAINSATFYITGVQLEKGSTATSFDYRPYGTELALCQRYYETALIAVTNNANAQYMNNYFRVTKRIAPTTFTVSAGGQTWAATTDAFYPSTTGSLITSATYAASSEL